MKRYCIVGVIVLGFATAGSWAQVPCRVRAKPVVEVAMRGLVASDLFAADSCPELLQAAARVPLGKAPLPGSARVMNEEEVRDLVQNIFDKDESLRRRPALFQLPHRVMVRRAGDAASCSDIWAGLFQSSASAAPDRATEAQSAGATGCGAGGRIARAAQIQAVRKIWDPALRRWNLLARCAHPADCVPFLMQMPVTAGTSFAASVTLPELAPKSQVLRQRVVAAGQKATLLWEQDGIRLTIPAVCLDAGAAGDTVRARMTHGGRVVRARVLEAGRLRAIS